MNNITQKSITAGGSIERLPVEIAKQLNLNVLELLKTAQLTEDYNLPVHHCNPNVLPDSFELFKKAKNLTVSKSTALAHYVYDRQFDNKNGLYTAIYLNDRKQLKFYKQFYSKVNFIIAHDYSIFDDVDLIASRENEYRLWKIRILMLWLVNNTNAIVIPNAVYVAAEKMPEYYSGLTDCSVICFSLKSHMRHNSHKQRIKETIRFVVDNFYNLKVILVYSACGIDTNALELFKYATSHGIKIMILPNRQREINMRQLEVKS